MVIPVVSKETKRRKGCRKWLGWTGLAVVTVSILGLGRTCERSYVGLRCWTLKHGLTVLTCRRVTDGSSAYRICHHDRSSHVVPRIWRAPLLNGGHMTRCSSGCTFVTASPIGHTPHNACSRHTCALRRIKQPTFSMNESHRWLGIA